MRSSYLLLTVVLLVLAPASPARALDPANPKANAKARRGSSSR